MGNVDKRLNSSTATIVASLIAGVCAVAAATLPNVFAPTPDPPAPNLQTAAAMSAVPHTVPANLPTTVPSPASPPKPNFTYGTWTITDAKDDTGTSFRNSTIKFTSQQETADGLELAGFFEWREHDVVIGREFFAGRYVAADRHLFFEGQTVQSPTGQLAIGSYACKLSDDGRRLIDGTWGNTPGNLAGVLGEWQARR